MAIVRELVTVLGTAVDQTGFHQYETGIARIKELALGLGKMLGLAFGAEKVIGFVDGLIDAGKEINKIRAQLNLVARPFDDMDAAQQNVFETAQQLGVAYKDVFETFKQFSTEMRETEIPQDQILQTTKNIYEAMRVERASPERIQEVMSVFERTFKRGAMRSVGVGQLFGLSPELFKMLEDHFNTNEEGLRKLAKAGEITAEEITKAFGKTSAELDAKFAKVPVKIGQAFTIIYNDLVNVTAQIYKMTDASVFMGRVILYVWRSFRDAIKSTVDYVGGLKNAIQLLGIALAVALGPWLLATLASVVTLTLSWAAANALLLLGWIAIAAAIAGVAIAIQDIIFWVQGKESLIGTWVGPFEDLAENFKKLDIFSGFRLFSDAFKGDWESFKKDWNIFINDGPGQIALITGAVTAIGVAFGTLGPIMWGVYRAFKSLTVAAKETAAAAEVKALAGKSGVPAVAGSKLAGPRVAGKLAGAAQLGLVGWDLAESLGLVKTGVDRDRLSDATTGALIGSFFGPAGTFAGGVGGALWKRPGFLPEWFDQSPGELIENAFRGKDPKTGYIPDAPYVPPETTTEPIVTNWLQEHFGYLLPGLGKLGESLDKEKATGYIPETSYVPSLPPGAIGPTPGGPNITNTDINPVLNQTNNIHVETALDAAQIGQVVQDQVNQSGVKMIDDLSRTLRTSAPRVEAPTQ